MHTSGPRETLRFGDFALDVAAYDLRRRGRAIKLGRQPMDLLILLVESRGLLVSRSQIVDRLWGKDVFVDVETGVNTAISKVRQALRDSADTPAFVETVPGRGYRFIAAVEAISAPSEPGSEVALPGPTPAPEETPRPRRRTTWGRLVIPLLVVAMAAGVLAWTRLRGSPAGPGVTLAVLPFENLGSDPAREYLAAGLTEETSASLAQIDPEHLSVKGRTLPYKGTTKTAVEIGRELTVDYLLESSIRTEGDRLRVTVTLLRVRDEEHVWSQSYDRETTTLLGLQQELSTAIAEQIRLRLSPDHLNGVGLRQTHNAEAYDAYLRGRHLQGRRTPDGNARAIDEYKRAIALDPNYALAWSSLAFTYAGSAVNGDARPHEVEPLARDAALHAVRANPHLAEAQFAMGYVDWLLDWDWKAAETSLRLTIELDPSNAAGPRTLGHALSQMHRDREAESAMRRTRELEPLEPMSYALSAQVAFQGRDNPTAIAHARRAVLIDSELWIGYVELAQAYAQIGESELALEALSDATRLSWQGNSKAVSLRGYILAKTGRTNQAREVLRTLEAGALERYVPPYAMALIHAGLGERDAVFVELGRAYAERDIHLIYLPVDPKWDEYRADRRFTALLAECGFASTMP